jgi:hypothetical protein
LFLFSGLAKAQGSDEREDGGGGADNYAFGIGAGLIEPRGTTETYFTANLRIRGHRGGEGDEDRPRQGGITGYFEPEVGYWTRSSSGGNKISGSDTLVGANLVGVVPLGRVDNFFGIGAGVHFVDAKLLTGDATETGSKSKLGLNAQFGVDIYLTNKVSLFGVGRFDLVQDASDNVQSKVYVGVRSRF